MKALRIAWATLIATWVLLLIGGTVNPMGASMACPDWYFVPTCNGELLPEMTGGVLYEHGHRLWASWVGILTIALTVAVWFGRRGDRTSRGLAVGALVLVCVQGSLGGITVLLNLHPAFSTLHLGTSMVFFSLLILLCFRLVPGPADIGPSGDSVTARRVGLSVVIAFVFVQILMGGLVRHLGAGLICGDDWLGCGPGAWTKQPLAHLHMTHRVIAYALVPLTVFASRTIAREATRCGKTLAARMAWWPTLAVLVQVALGLLTVATGRSVVIVTFHTAIAAVVLGTLVAAFIALGPQGARLEARR